MTDPTSQLQQLRAMRDQLPEAMRAQFDAQIAALEALLQPPAVPPAQAITNIAPNQGAQGVFYGSVYLYGQRGKQASELIGSYLTRQIQRCGSLPLQGVYQQRASDDTLTISLEQVYTQLATTELTLRESFAGEALEKFDAEAYLKQHVGAHLLPAQQRIKLRQQWSSNPAFQERLRSRVGDVDALDLAHVSSADLARYAKETTIPLHHFLTDTIEPAPITAISFLGPQLVTEAITQHQHLVLLGEPGSGKSTALRYLALTLAQAGLDESVNLAAQLDGWDVLGEQGRLLPLFLPLLPFAKRFVNPADHPCNADDLWNYIAAELEANERYEGLAAAVHEELENGRVLLLLDGLDEVAGSASRRQMVRAVQAFVQHYPQCHIVVTCRVRAYEGEHNAEWQLPGWQTATLADWTVGQMQHFVQAWYAAAASGGMSDEKRDERTAALQGAIARRDDLKRLGVRPLLLTIMALVHYNDGQLPEERVGLYSRCVDLLLGQWELAKEDGSGYGKLTDYIGLPDTDVKALRPLLQQAALAAHEASSTDNPGSLGRLTLREMVMKTLHEKGHRNPFEGAERFLDYTDVRSGLLQASDAGDSYRFPHLTFQEYLAGLELVRGVKFIDRILELRTDDRWRVPIQLGIGHLVSENTLAGPYQLFNKLLKLKGRSEEQRQRDLLLLAELGEDVGWSRLTAGDELFEELRDELAAALVPVVEGTTLPAIDRVQAGVYLCELGDPRPGVCTLPPDMISFEDDRFWPGSTEQEIEQTYETFKQKLPDMDDDDAESLLEMLRYELNVWPEQELLDAFQISCYPITNAQYALFIEDDGYNPNTPWWDDEGRQWLMRNDSAYKLHPFRTRTHKNQPEFWNEPRLGRQKINHPVTGISWFEANAFCQWLTQNMTYNPEGYIYNLPSELEWEFVARGSERRIYPWGKCWPDPERANYGGIYGGTTPVGCFRYGKTPEGVYDLAGSILEMTRTPVHAYNQLVLFPHLEPKITASSDSARIIVRNGGWGDTIVFLRSATRTEASPDNFHPLGFRLVRYPPNRS